MPLGFCLNVNKYDFFLSQQIAWWVERGWIGTNLWSLPALSMQCILWGKDALITLISPNEGFNDNYWLELGMRGDFREDGLTLQRKDFIYLLHIAQSLTTDQPLEEFYLDTLAPNFWVGLELQSWSMLYFSTQIRSKSSRILFAFSDVFAWCSFLFLGDGRTDCFCVW